MQSDAEEVSDDDLIERVAAGDRRAFSALMSRHLDRAYSLAHRMTGSRSDAEDIVQEALARVWTKASSWQRGGARFSTWLYRVVLNLCVDLRRRSRLRPEGLDAAEEVVDPGPGAEASLAEAQRNARVAAAVAALPERQRAAVVLTYTTGLSNAEAAELMHLSVKAFEALLVRARRTLRASLADAEL
ncbi:MAG: RNA polymerase sigma factor [Rhodospirillaceae bacterium]|nr:RNA polymerase sigma factor [Rhodospirillaceae bacterium]